ncbi:hypothetical protein V6R21_04155 [Limibacter armeniacum]|uniref:hypothetical protein n=1 Tax=Limibacter armeniacum TaxID=466084 RepID=UPI002FE60EF0
MLKTITNHSVHYFDGQKQLLITESHSVAPTKTSHLLEMEITQSCLFKYNPHFWLVDISLLLDHHISVRTIKEVNEWQAVLKRTNLEKIAFVTGYDSTFSFEYVNLIFEKLKWSPEIPEIKFESFSDKNEAKLWLKG